MLLEVHASTRLLQLEFCNKYFTLMLNQLWKRNTETEHRPKKHCVKQNITSLIGNIFSIANNPLFSLLGSKALYFVAKKYILI